MKPALGFGKVKTAVGVDPEEVFVFGHRSRAKSMDCYVVEDGKLVQKHDTCVTNLGIKKHFYNLSICGRDGWSLKRQRTFMNWNLLSLVTLANPLRIRVSRWYAAYKELSSRGQ